MHQKSNYSIKFKVFTQHFNSLLRLVQNFVGTMTTIPHLLWPTVNDYFAQTTHFEQGTHRMYSRDDHTSNCSNFYETELSEHLCYFQIGYGTHQPRRDHRLRTFGPSINCKKQKLHYLKGFSLQRAMKQPTLANFNQIRSSKPAFKRRWSFVIYSISISDMYIFNALDELSSIHVLDNLRPTTNGLDSTYF